MKLPSRFQIGDIIQRLPSRDPFDTFTDLLKKYGTLTFIVADIDEKYITSINKRFIVYKIICMQDDSTLYLSLKEQKLWRKIA